MAFVHLHNHSDFSILDGAARIPDIVRRAVELKMPAVALTDHGYLFGVPNLDLECRKYNEAACAMKQWEHDLECFEKGWKLEEPAPVAPTLSGRAIAGSGRRRTISLPSGRTGHPSR